MEQPKEQKKVGPIIVALIVVLLIIIGILYAVATRLSSDPAAPRDPATDQRATSSFDKNSIQNDLNSSLNGLE